MGKSRYINLTGKNAQKIIKNGRLEDFVFTSDGRFITASSNLIIIWDLFKGQIINFINIGNSRVVKSIDISNDNKFLAAGDSQGFIYIWDLKSFKLISENKIAKGEVKQIRFSADPDVLFIHLVYRLEHIYDYTYYTVFFRISDNKKIFATESKKTIASSVAFDAASPYFATCFNGSVNIRDISDGKSLLEFEVDEENIRSLYISPVHPLVAVSEEESVSLIGKDFSYSIPDVYATQSLNGKSCFSPDGNFLILRSLKFFEDIYVYDIQTSKYRKTRGFSNFIYDFLPDGCSIITLTDSKILEKFCLKTFEREFMGFSRAEINGCWDVFFNLSKDGKRLLYLTQDYNLESFDLCKREIAYNIDNFSLPTLGMQISDGKKYVFIENGMDVTDWVTLLETKKWHKVFSRCISCYFDTHSEFCADDKYIIIRPQEQTECSLLRTDKFECKNYEAWANPIDIGIDSEGRLISARSNDNNTIDIYSIPDIHQKQGIEAFSYPQEMSEILSRFYYIPFKDCLNLKSHKDEIIKLLFSHDLSLLASCDIKGNILLWNKDGIVISEKIKMPGTRIRNVRISKDNRTICVDNNQDTVVAWDIPSKRRIISKRFCQIPLYPFPFSPDHSKIIISDRNVWLRFSMGSKRRPLKFYGSRENIIAEKWHRLELMKKRYFAYIYDLKNGEEILRINVSDPARLPFAFSSDSKFLIAGHIDGNIDLWDLSTRSIIKSYKCNSSEIISVVFMDGDKKFLAGCIDGSLRLFTI